MRLPRLSRATTKTSERGGLRTALAVSLAVIVGAAVLTGRPPTVQAATFVVNSTGDAPDAVLNGTCETATPGECTLRAAIQESNFVGGTDTINFNIAPGPPVKTIAPASALPSITQSVVIDGYTQPGSSVNTLATGTNAVLTIELTGATFPQAFIGLTVVNGNATIRGLNINQFQNGIGFSGGGTSGLVIGNFIGTDPTGTAPRGNREGIALGFGPPPGPVTIGTPAIADRNLISANTGRGIAGTANLARIQNNLVGTDATGTLDLGNAGAGIDLTGGGNLIGGAGAGNVVSGNDFVGIQVNGSSAVIEGNIAGLNAAGTGALGNRSDGIWLAGGGGHRVGGTVAGAGNVSSGNNLSARGLWIDASSTTTQGNKFGTDVTGTVAIPNAGGGVTVRNSSTSTIGGTSLGMGNLISGNASAGIEIQVNASGTQIQGNIIGLDVTGASLLGNTFTGIAIAGSTTTVGGSAVGARNIISGSTTSQGISVSGSATSAIIRGNYIGTDITGTLDRGNAREGILCCGPGTNIGGFNPGEGNVISGNGGDGIEVVPGPNGVIFGNRIGTSAAGTAVLGNDGDGIFINSAKGVVVGTSAGTTPGGPCTGACNLISGNLGQGIQNNQSVVLGFDNTRVQGNMIGLDVTGTFDFGNRRNGIILFSVQGNLIGGTSAAERNVISGNDQNGIQSISCFGPCTNDIRGNYIGTSSAGTGDVGNTLNGILTANALTIGQAPSGPGNVISGNDRAGVEINGALAKNVLLFVNSIGVGATGGTVGNATEGILITNAANGTRIGQSGPGGNTIRNNGGDGVFIDPSAGTGNFFSSNSIDNNGGLGVDLGADGVTPNDAMDPDAGPNDLQNYPVLSSAIVTGGTTLNVLGNLNSTPSLFGAFSVEYFRSTACNPSGHGEGATFLNVVFGISTDGAGDAPLSFTFGSAAPGFITAAATGPGPNTSEFSACRPIVFDFDADGVLDPFDNCVFDFNPLQENNDADSFGDVCDPDDDNDGVGDPFDNCQFDANTLQENNDGDALGDVCDPDDDNDTVLDGVDNCQFDANTLQENNDGDALGDVCDPDDDNDTVLDGVDNCVFDPTPDRRTTTATHSATPATPTTTTTPSSTASTTAGFDANTLQENNDGDALGDVCDPDDDNDTVLDGVDNCVFDANPGQENNDGDALGDVCDPDDDNDTVLDGVDNCQFDANTRQDEQRRRCDRRRLRPRRRQRHRPRRDRQLPVRGERRPDRLRRRHARRRLRSRRRQRRRQRARRQLRVPRQPGPGEQRRRPPGRRLRR